MKSLMITSVTRSIEMVGDIKEMRVLIKPQSLSSRNSEIKRANKLVNKGLPAELSAVLQMIRDSREAQKEDPLSYKGFLGIFQEREG